ncbi:TetR/AcrR family transcriptional regulator [Weissella coleopterorum]|uniref:TetR/AcrR family transcriptional regulator n=1 Tax=Weissella coleopterorum TaxID=2714949 RepID=A0A6G8AZA2_9LACO|nr:TetR/AcrR family transcriptional regulator [Weissella coleopterorum]QIL50336.1 TetR/AcrR family transcriptional regulator [Weissella coleopterorum]
MKEISNSKKQLLKALAYFLNDKPIEEIKVSELINKAYISRSTFYRSFETKEEFFEWVLEYYMEGLSGASLNNADNPISFYTHYFDYISENAVYFRAFNNSSMWPQFISALNQNGVHIYQVFISQMTDNKNLSYLVSNYVISAHIGVVTSWLNNDLLVSPTNIASIVTEMTTSALKSQGFSLGELFNSNT